MIRFDTHVHSTFSADGRDGLEAYARRVDAGVVDGIGFAEHYEFWPSSDTYGFMVEAEYLAEVGRWREEGYRFFAGVEVDWMPEYRGAILEALATHPFAFVLASVHNLPSASISGKDIEAFTGDAAFGRILGEYHEAVASSLEVSEFDVVGHIGVYSRHLPPDFWVGKPWKARVAELEDDLARKVAASGKLIEVNTSGLFCDRAESCAGEFFLTRYRHYGGRTVTLGSDAHRAEDLGRGFDRAGALLSRLGFDRVFLPWDREHPIPLISS